MNQRMIIFTRSPLAYWGDRIFIAVLLCSLGAFLAISAFVMVAQERTGLGPIPVVGPVLGIAFFIVGIWAFFQPWPTRVEIDVREVRIFHRPAKVITIARKNIVGAKSQSTQRGGTAFGIVYKNTEGKTRGVKLYGGWRDSDGARLRSVPKAFNAALGTSSPPTPFY